MTDPEYKKITIIIEDSTWRRTVIFNKTKMQGSPIEFDYNHDETKITKASIEFGVELDDHNLYYIVKEEAL